MLNDNKTGQTRLLIIVSITNGEKGLSLSIYIKRRNGYSPTEIESVTEDICEWQSVSWESEKRRMTFLWRRVSAAGGAGKGTVSPSLQWLTSLLYKKAVGHFPRGLSFTQSPFIFLPICHLSPPSHAMSPDSLLPLLSLSLCQPLLNQIDGRCVSSVKEDSLLLYSYNPSVWHSASTNALCCNSSVDSTHM